MSKVDIRSMVQADCKAVYEIEKLCFSGTSWTLEDFYDALSVDSQYYFVAEQQGCIVGFAALYVMIDCGDLVNIAVHPSYRRQGISHRLMEMLLQTASELALQCITLEVRIGNTAAIHLYQKHGFRKISTRKGYYKNPVEDADIMQKSIEQTVHN